MCARCARDRVRDAREIACEVRARSRARCARGRVRGARELACEVRARSRGRCARGRVGGAREIAWEVRARSYLHERERVREALAVRLVRLRGGGQHTHKSASARTHARASHRIAGGVRWRERRGGCVGDDRAICMGDAWAVRGRCGLDRLHRHV